MMTKESKYSLLPYDGDLESDSSSIHSSEKGPLSLQHTSASPFSGHDAGTLSSWLRWGTVVGLQTLLVALLLLRTGNEGLKDSRVVETGSDINGLYQTCDLIKSESRPML